MRCSHLLGQLDSCFEGARGNRRVARITRRKGTEWFRAPFCSVSLSAWRTLQGRACGCSNSTSEYCCALCTDARAELCSMQPTYVLSATTHWVALHCRRLPPWQRAPPAGRAARPDRLRASQGHVDRTEDRLRSAPSQPRPTLAALHGAGQRRRTAWHGMPPSLSSDGLLVCLFVCLFVCLLTIRQQS